MLFGIRAESVTNRKKSFQQKLCTYILNGVESKSAIQDRASRLKIQNCPPPTNMKMGGEGLTIQ